MDKDKKIKIDQVNFIEELNLYNNKNNIINQLPAYNKEDTDYFIKNLETEYEQQKTLNLVLKNKETSKEIENIETFINNNNIDKKLEKLINISEDLKKIVIDIKKLQDNNNELKKLINSKKYNEIANKLKSIKKIKDDIKDFLGKNGIISII